MRIDPEIMARIRDTIMAELPGVGGSIHINDLFDVVKRKLKLSGVLKEDLSKGRFSTAIKYLRDRKQLKPIRLRNNQVSYFKTGNVLKRMANTRSTEKTCDLILPDHRMTPIEFSVHLLAQSQFSDRRTEIL